MMRIVDALRRGTMLSEPNLGSSAADTASEKSMIVEPRQLGGLYEIRLYTLRPGGIPGVIDRWSTAIADRVKLSPLAFAGHSEFGGLNRWCHIWAYKDAAERFAVREKARKEGIWPPK